MKYLTILIFIGTIFSIRYYSHTEMCRNSSLHLFQSMENKYSRCGSDMTCVDKVNKVAEAQLKVLDKECK